MNKNKLRVFESFAGVGSQRMALRNIGINFEIVGISEIQKWGLLAYSAIHESIDLNTEVPSDEEMYVYLKNKNVGYNFSTDKFDLPKKGIELKKIYIADKITKNMGDIIRINPYEMPDFDLFTYSYPCKDISVAGHQRSLEEGSGTASSLLWECKKIVDLKKPKYLMMENVKNLVGKNHIKYFNQWIEYLESLGYSNYYKVFNAKNFNVPQNRERVIMISILNNTEDVILPEGKLTDKIIKDILEDEVSDNYYINKNRYENVYEVLENQDISYCIDANYWKGTSVVGYKTKRRRQLVNDKNNGKMRRLTPLECWRLMGYKDEDFYKAKDIGGLSSTNLYERAGRGIVVPMLEDIFKLIFKDYMI